MSGGSVWAVFSMFRPSETALEAVGSVVSQVDGVVVVDDGSGESADGVFERLVSDRVTVIRRSENRGIAAALNDGMARARAAGARYVVTFDQDSRVPPGFVSALLRTHDDATADGVRVGLVVPEYFAGVRQQRGEPAAYGDAVDVIQSGMLISSTLVEELGGLREDYFIDRVDTEYELRVKKHGRRVLAAGGVRMEHALGVAYRRELFGRPVRIPGIPPEIPLSTPFRYYYRVRNRIVLDREYFRTAPGRIVRDTVLDAVHFASALSIARPRRALLRVYRAGIAAAVRGRMGRMPSGLVPIASEIRWNAPVVAREER